MQYGLDVSPVGNEIISLHVLLVKFLNYLSQETIEGYMNFIESFKEKVVKTSMENFQIQFMGKSDEFPNSYLKKLLKESLYDLFSII